MGENGGMTPAMRAKITVSDPAAIAAVLAEQARRGIRTAARTATTLLVEYCAELRAMRRGAEAGSPAPVQGASHESPSAEPPAGGAVQLTGAPLPAEAKSIDFGADSAEVIAEPRPRRRSPSARPPRSPRPAASATAQGDAA